MNDHSNTLPSTDKANSTRTENTGSIPVRSSIATHLISVVFSFYLILTISVTIVHMVVEYNHTKQSVLNEIGIIQQTFEPGLSKALWDLNAEQLRLIALGMVRFPSVVGIKIFNEHGELVGARGTVLNEGQSVIIDNQGSAKPSPGVAELFWHTIPIKYAVDNIELPMGEMTIYSNSAVVFERVQVGFLFIIGNSIIKTIALWAIFLVVGRLYLSKPLSSLISATQQVRVDNLKTISVNLRTLGRNELKLLEESFNDMVRKLQGAFEEQQRMELALRWSESRFRAIFNNMAMGILVVNLEGEFIQCNNKWGEMLLMDPDQTEGLSLWDFIVEEDRTLMGHSFNHLISGRLQNTRLEVRLIRHNQKFLWSEVYITAIYTARGELEYILCGVVDISERKQAEEYVRRINEELERHVQARTEELKKTNDALTESMDQLKHTQDQLIVQEKLASLGALTAGIAHEMKNPLNFINNYASLISELMTELSEEMKEVSPELFENNEAIKDLFTGLHHAAKVVCEQGKRADGIVKNMLLHSRTRTGELSRVNINEIIRENVNFSYHGLKAQKSGFYAQFDLDLDAEVPEIMGDAQGLGRVFLNLFANAFYSMSNKIAIQGEGYDPVLQIKTTHKQRFVEIRVRDNGMGIPKEQQQQIFTPFYTTKPTGEGTGLGLSICHEIVTQIHQGDIYMHSEMELFTEFVINLPYAPESDPSSEVNLAI